MANIASKLMQAIDDVPAETSGKNRTDVEVLAYVSDWRLEPIPIEISS